VPPLLWDITTSNIVIFPALEALSADARLRTHVANRCFQAKTALPIVSTVVIFNSFQGQYFHLRGIAQRPGGFSMARYNMEMGPPTFAPLLFGLVGGMGLLAAILRRER
jgi:hypothetical protein